MIEGACSVKISISISFVCFSLSDLVGKFTFLSPWHSFSLVVYVLSKVEHILLAFWDAPTDDFFCYLIYGFYPIHVLLQLCLGAWCFGFSIHFFTTILFADCILSNNMGN